MSNKLKPIFQEPPDGLDSDWTHGVLLVALDQGMHQMEWIEAARVYSRTTLHLIDRALERGVEWDEAQPALFMCRHALELYLKALIPDWRKRKKEAEKEAKLKKTGGHDLTIFSLTLKELLKEKYDESDILELSELIDKFQEHDPDAMLFRFPDGVKPGAHLGAEIWVDFIALKESMTAVFNALDSLWLNKDRLKEATA